MKTLRSISYRSKCTMAFVAATVFLVSCISSGPHWGISKKALAQIGFYETYSTDELSDAFLQMCNEVSKNDTSFKAKKVMRLLNFTDTSFIEGLSGSPIICSSLASDTAAVNSVIAQYGGNFLPKDLKLAWTFKPDQSRDGMEYYKLIALKTHDGSPEMTGEPIIEFSKEIDKFSGYVISMRLDEKGTREWSGITAKNVGRYIAIVIAEKVYSFPIVRSQIDGGRIGISGNFTEEEVDSIVNFVWSERL